MPSSTLKRLSGLAGVFAGVLFVVAELLNPLVIPDTLRSASDSLGEIASTDGFIVQSLLTLLAGMLLLVALTGLYLTQSEAAGKLGAVGALVAYVGTILMVGDFYANTFVTPLVALSVPEYLSSYEAGVLRIWFPVEFGLFAVSWLLFAVATLRARVYPGGAALLLLVGAVVALPPVPFVNVFFYFAVIWLGFALFSGSIKATPRVSTRRG
jgi:hypothetical protein